MDRKKVLRSLIFLSAGIVIFWLVFRDTDLSALKREFMKVRWKWIGVSLLLNLTSLLIRSIRWRLLFGPMQYKPSLFNLFLADVIMAFTNQVIPRGGEFTRLTVVHRTERIPFAKLFGSVLAERLTDLLILLILFGILITWQFQMFTKILHLEEFQGIEIGVNQVLIIAGIVAAAVVTGWILVKKFKILKKFNARLIQIRSEIREGFMSLMKIRKKGLFLALSLTIFVTSFFMFYVLFFAFPATAELSLTAAVFTFGLATSAFLLPIQSGLGAWHFLVIQALLLYGIDPESGKAFSLIAHATTNLVNLPLGALALLILALKKNKYGSGMK